MWCQIKLQTKFNHNLDLIFKNNIPKAVAIACSGGRDSIALVSLFKNWQRQFNFKCEIYVLTVDHQLRSESAQEAEWTAQIMKKWKLFHVILKWQHQELKTVNAYMARKARYNLLLEFCQQNNIPWLLTGHQADDQKETILIRLLQKSHLKGLAGISAVVIRSGINIGRPLLSITRHDLTYYLNSHKIAWMEDASNNQSKYLRNRLRKVNLHFSEKWIEHLQSYRVCEERWAKKFIDQNGWYSPIGFWQGNLNSLKILPIPFLEIIIEHILLNLVSQEYPFRYDKIRRLGEYIKDPLKNKSTLGGYIFEKKKEYLLIYRSHNNIKEVINGYQGGNVSFDNRWQLNIRIMPKGYTIKKIGPNGWHQLISKNEEIKKLSILKLALMALPWFWDQEILVYKDIFIELILKSDTKLKSMLKFCPTYELSDFHFFQK